MKMTYEEIKEHLQIGCKIKLCSGSIVLPVTDYHPSISTIYLEGYKCSFGPATINEIVSWPIPEQITTGWIKFKEPQKNDASTIQFVSPMEEYTDQWQKVIASEINGYCSIIKGQEHLRLGDNIPYWKIRKQWVTDWRPIAPDIKQEEQYISIPLVSQIIIGDEIKVSSDGPWLMVIDIRKPFNSNLIYITYKNDDGSNNTLPIKSAHIYSARRKVSNNNTNLDNKKEIHMKTFLTQQELNQIKPGWYVTFADEKYITEYIKNDQSGLHFFYSEDKIKDEAGKICQVDTVYISKNYITTKKYGWDVEFIISASPDHPDANIIVSDNKNKQEDKNMLNTVEEIGKLDKPNLEEAAKQVKASRDNDEVTAAKKKLTELLDQESGLKARKKEIDEELAKVQELIKAFGYPPPTAK